MAAVPGVGIDDTNDVAWEASTASSEKDVAVHEQFWDAFNQDQLDPISLERLRTRRALERQALRSRPMIEVVYEIGKRAFDIIVASLVLAVVIVPVLALALLTKLYDGGPMFFRQVRIGRYGRPFMCFKIRTMVPNAAAIQDHVADLNHHTDSLTFKIPKDPRITPLGRLLRKSSIDELPQLLNVLSGQMSLVGPRPALPREVELYSGRDYQRLLVKPGLTCIWQVSGRGDIPFGGQVEMDLLYVRRRSLWLDLKLLLMTVPAVLSMRGAY